MGLILFSIILLYCFFIIQLVVGFTKVKNFEVKNFEAKTPFTIIIPFRNEAKNLPRLLKSISKLQYPRELIEIILVDDFSTDQSERICIDWRMIHHDIDTTLLENLRLTNSPKKDAISRAMPIAKNNWIITTDADCIVPKNWLLTLDHYIQTNDCHMIVGAVTYKAKNNWFHHFQELDLISLQGTTIGSFGMGKPFMCNGANFAYTKTFFYELEGFEGNSKIASGDDVFLLQKAVSKAPDKVQYLKHPNFIVKTKPENNLKNFFMQRVRWASKTSEYQSIYAKLLAAVVFAANLCIVLGFGYWILNKLEGMVFLASFILKYVADYILLYKTNTYLRKGKLLLPLASSFVYPFYSSIVGLYSFMGGYSWKGRAFKK